jgi:hypothetical protein
MRRTNLIFSEYCIDGKVVVLHDDRVRRDAFVAETLTNALTHFALVHSAMNHIRQVFISTRRPVRPSSVVLLCCRRTFSFTSRLQASEDEDAFLSQFKNTSVFSKLADKPEALMALRDFAELMRAQGQRPVL